jgi:hypothetical protein
MPGTKINNFRLSCYHLLGICSIRAESRQGERVEVLCQHGDTQP